MSKLNSNHNVICCYNASNLILTELRWICSKCGNECFTEQTGNTYGWLWKPDGKTHLVTERRNIMCKCYCIKCPCRYEHQCLDCANDYHVTKGDKSK